MRHCSSSRTKSACEEPLEVYTRKLTLAMTIMDGNTGFVVVRHKCHLPYDVSTLRRARSAFWEDLGQEVEAGERCWRSIGFSVFL
jgi:hypothetical protein